LKKYNWQPEYIWFKHDGAPELSNCIMGDDITFSAEEIGVGSNEFVW
jgi:hypothetical protein